jgi:putative endonuclease
MNITKKETGDYGEQTAKKFLIENGYRFVASNFSYDRLEIDLIFEDPKIKTLIFVEVKTRSSLRFGVPEEAIDKDKQKNIKTASKYFIKLNREFRSHEKRFDSVSVLMVNGEWKINHIPNSF